VEFAKGRGLRLAAALGRVAVGVGQVINEERFARQQLASLLLFLPRMSWYSGGWAMKMRPRRISSGICRKKNVSSSVRMWLPSTSASVMMMTLP
jgi:hypothetical protein